MSKESKSIRKTDDSAMALLHDILGVNATKVADIDSYYRIKGTYIFLEFIKVSEPLEGYSPNNNWEMIQSEILRLWEFTIKAEGSLWLICFKEDRSAFRLFKVESATKEQVTFQKVNDFDFEEFKKWFQLLNAEVLKG
ncbi:hypothetical protein [uncultured Imperialibacter sp.]|uniref:hypothetical protein n=1 Tax=uncultured Imperialibacter sp. TaxID=1672639 RepID=UPI0030D9B8F2|tara:strand:+ start:780 stop:1193 length:414 start_codon:yes stop_codon:yes gene_type:complete